eukprot:UC4_evm9s1370
MATTLISQAPPPNVDPTKSQVAYGDRAIPKINRELQASELIVRQRALMGLCDMLHSPEKTKESLNAGVISSLKSLLGDADNDVRIKATEALYLMAGHAVGRQVFVSDHIISPLSERFDDSVKRVRKNSHAALERCSRTVDAADDIISKKLIKRLVDKLKSEDDEIKRDTIDVLKIDSINVFTDLLEHSESNIRYGAARNLLDSSLPLDGKKQAVDTDKTIPRLVTLLADNTARVRSAAASALMSITIVTQGKVDAIKAGAAPALLTLLDDPDEGVKLNAIKAMTTLAEAPSGRQQLNSQANLDKLQTLCELQGERLDSSAVARAAGIAVKTITWKP